MTASIHPPSYPRATTRNTPQPFGEHLRFWRQHRRQSQMDLAHEADISTRHLSFVETGRSVPSREMVLRLSDRLEEAVNLMRRAIAMGLPDAHLFRTLFEAGAMEKKLGLEHAALATFTDLSLSPNPYRVKAYEELAKHYEHRERNFTMALECVRAARCAEDSQALATRQARLEKKRSAGTQQPRLGLSAATTPRPL